MDGVRVLIVRRFIERPTDLQATLEAGAAAREALCSIEIRADALSGLRQFPWQLLDDLARASTRATLNGDLTNLIQGVRSLPFIEGVTPTGRSRLIDLLTRLHDPEPEWGAGPPELQEPAWTDQPQNRLGLEIAPGISVRELPPAVVADLEDSAPVLLISKRQQVLSRRGRRAVKEHLTELLGQQLRAESDSYLSPAESRRVAIQLIEECRRAVSAGDTLSSEAALAWLLVLTTSWPLGLTVTLQVPDDTTNAWLSKDRTSFFVRVPNRDNFWQPTQELRSTHSVETPARQVAVPLPREVAELLVSVGENHASSSPKLFRSQQEALLAKAFEIRDALRGGECPRFSETRLRLALPIAVVDQTGEVVLAQLLSSQTLGQSGAPLAYYAINNQDLLDVYRRACEFQLGMSLPAVAVPDGLLGATTAILPAVIYRTIVDELKSDLTSRIRLRDERRRLRETHQQTVRYTATMLAACTGHRVNRWLLDFRLDVVHWTGHWACLQDKETVGVGRVRVVALPPMLLGQLRRLREITLALASSNIWPKLSSTLRSIADGSQPLFQFVGEAGELTPLSIDQLETSLHRTLGLPSNLWRARLRMQLTEDAVHPQWIHWQLGHQYLNEVPFGDHCPYSIRQFVERLTPALESALVAAGWTVQPPGSRRTASGVDPVFSVPRNPRQTHQTECQRLTTAANESADVTPTVNIDWLRSWAKNEAAELVEKSTSWNSHQIEAGIQSAVDSISCRKLSREEVIQALQLLRNQLTKVKPQAGESHRILPPLPLQPAPIVPQITCAHALCANAMDALAGYVHHHPLPTATDRLCALTVLIAQLGIACDGDRLCALVLNAIEQAPTLVGEPLRLIELEITPGTRRTFPLSEWVVHLSNRVYSGAGLMVTADLPRLLKRFAPQHLQDQRLPQLLDDLAECGALAARHRFPGLVSSVFAGEDPLTVTQTLSAQFVHSRVDIQSVNQFNSAQTQTLAATETDGASIDTVVLEESNASTADRGQAAQILIAFRRLTRTLSTASASATADRSVRAARRQARAATKAVLDDKAQSPTLHCLARYALAHLDRGAGSIQVRTLHTYLTSFGGRLLDHLTGQAVTDLDPDQLAEIYLAVIEDARRTSGQSRLAARVAQRLLEFHRANADYLPQAPLARVLSAAGVAGEDRTRVDLISSAELDLTTSVITELQERGTMSGLQTAASRALLVTLYELGARLGEITHLRQVDLYRQGASLELLIRSTGVSTLKTPGSRRVHRTKTGGDERWGEALNQLIALNPPGEDQRRSVFALEPEVDRLRLVNEVRALLEQATGGRTRSLHVLRHTRATHSLLKLLVATDKDKRRVFTTYSVARQLGHSSAATTRTHYWHGAAIAALAMIDQATTPSLAFQAAALGISPVAAHRRFYRARAAASVDQTDSNQQGSSITDDLPQLARTIADRITSDRALRRPLELYRLLVALASRTVGVSLAVQRRALTRIELSGLLRETATIAAELGVVVISVEQRHELADLIGEHQSPDLGRRQLRAVRLSPLAARRDATRFRSPLIELNERQLERMIRAFGLKESYLSAPERELLAINSLLPVSPLDCLQAAALLVERRLTNTRSGR